MNLSPLHAGLRCPAAARPLAMPRDCRRRRRRALWLAPLALAAVAGLLLGARWLLTAERFAVQHVESGAYRFCDPLLLEARLAGALGGNIWTGHAARRLAADLTALPWVRQVRVTRELPATLRVELEEWRPLLRVQPDTASAAAAAGVLVLLGDGRVTPFPPHLPPPELPVLAGAAVAPAPDGQWRLAGGLADTVLALVTAVGETGIETFAPVDFVLADGDGLSLVLQGGGGRLVLGGEDFDARLRRFLAVSARLEPGSVVDLRFGRRVFVGGRAEESADPDAAPSPAVGEGRPRVEAAGGAPAAARGKAGRAAA